MELPTLPPGSWHQPAIPRCQPAPVARQTALQKLLLGVTRRRAKADEDLHVFTVLSRLGGIFLPYLLFLSQILMKSRISRVDKERIILRVAWRVGCVYEWGHHVHMATELGVAGEVSRRRVLPAGPEPTRKLAHVVAQDSGDPPFARSTHSSWIDLGEAGQHEGREAEPEEVAKSPPPGSLGGLLPSTHDSVDGQGDDQGGEQVQPLQTLVYRERVLGDLKEAVPEERHELLEIGQRHQVLTAAARASPDRRRRPALKSRHRGRSVLRSGGGPEGPGPRRCRCLAGRSGCRGGCKLAFLYAKVAPAPPAPGAGSPGVPAAASRVVAARRAGG